MFSKADEDIYVEKSRSNTHLTRELNGIMRKILYRDGERLKMAE